ncbi:Techylectin-5A, partial [Araneus ventricosus]
VIQRRGDFNRTEDYFFKDWMSYKRGFGDIDKDFWLGNDNIFALTNQRLSSIRFDLQSLDGEKRYAHYDSFWIDDENNNYTLHIKDYIGDAGDSMSEVHDNYQFSTNDRDNDVNKEWNCAVKFKGAWWYSNCHLVNLNGLYLRPPLPERESKLYADGINWTKWKGHREVLPATEMKVRPRSFEKALKGLPPFQI